MSFLKRSKGKETAPESVGLFLLERNPPRQIYDIDIIAVHGLGGHWERTWKDSETNKVWLRDFLPLQLRDSNINPRVFSYGYDSSVAFSRSITDINDVADDFLDRLSHVRPNVADKRRPILLIAHSLGGLIVKKAIITAWNQSNHYGELLQTIRGIVFFGVPHRGADVAYWAGLPASLLDYTLAGFGGNTAFLNALKRSSPTWREISIQFIERAAPPLKIRTFSKRKGLVVDKDSARLYLPNERFTGVANSNHKSMCKFGVAESQRYAPVWMAIRDMAQEAIGPTIANRFENRDPIIITDTPSKTPNFFGRESELQTMRDILKPRDFE
ncbi:Alpha/Beta hydrolase protein [Hyaloscypha finlandica]|nr:Alpha/Beta hydrolase protein [Hyaloscypha finlandica]